MGPLVGGTLLWCRVPGLSATGVGDYDQLKNGHYNSLCLHECRTELEILYFPMNFGLYRALISVYERSAYYIAVVVRLVL